MMRAMIRFLPAVVVFLLWVFCLVDLIGTREDRVRNLPKLWWILIVLFFPLVGSIAWLVAGRPQAARPVARPPGRTSGTTSGYAEYERPGRFAAADPAKDEEFLRQVRERAEQQRRDYEERRRRERDPQDEPGA